MRLEARQVGLRRSLRWRRLQEAAQRRAVPRSQDALLGASLKSFVACVRKNGYTAMPEANSRRKVPQEYRGQLEVPAGGEEVLQHPLPVAGGASTTSTRQRRHPAPRATALPCGGAHCLRAPPRQLRAAACGWRGWPAGTAATDRNLALSTFVNPYDTNVDRDQAGSLPLARVAQCRHRALLAGIAKADLLADLIHRAHDRDRLASGRISPESLPAAISRSISSAWNCMPRPGTSDSSSSGAHPGRRRRGTRSGVYQTESISIRPSVPTIDGAVGPGRGARRCRASAIRPSAYRSRMPVSGVDAGRPERGDRPHRLQGCRADRRRMRSGKHRGRAVLRHPAPMSSGGRPDRRRASACGRRSPRARRRSQRRQAACGWRSCAAASESTSPRGSRGRAAAASSTRLWASRALIVNGFSTRTCLPASTQVPRRRDGEGVGWRRRRCPRSGRRPAPHSCRARVRCPNREAKASAVCAVREPTAVTT